ncbi:MAG: tRNA (adenosine(37)-N6)-threonylcarbamoyltransferase complex dimerization subunit type 1 TsaB [Alphaproteobacteria bacterium]|nr:tRNA (adenosine(37)-N6)-threonylcarbamoyltransferase complex dimerization subunit type 1 TsaB [Alphaproteobacteria bacterium]
MRILAVDTALGACSAALIGGDKVLAHRFVPMERGHAEALAPMVAELMAGVAYTTLTRLAVTTGPGTFTGQRIGLAFMRGLRIAHDLPLVGITSLSAMAAQAAHETGLTAAALHDARRSEVYFEMQDGPMLLSFDQALVQLSGRPSDAPIALAGTAAERACAALGTGFVLSGVRQPDARWVARLAAQAPAPLGPPQPLYLRAPDARLPAAP